MEFRRTLLIVAMAVVGYFLLINWQKDYGQQAQQAQQAPATRADSAGAAPAGELPAAPPADAAKSNSDIPVAPAKAAAAADLAATSGKGALVSVKTDVLDVQIDLTGGDLVRAALPGYTETNDSPKPFVLLDNSAALTHVAQSGLIGENGPDANPAGRPQYRVAAPAYELKEGEQSLQVALELPEVNGVTVRKIYEFQRGNYLVNVRYEIVNAGAAPWKGMMFGQLKRDNSVDPSAANQGFGMSTFLGAAWWSPEKSYNKLALSDMAEEPVKVSATGGWIAMVQHYFVTAWVPDAKASNHFTTRVNTQTGENFMVYTGPEVAVAPGQSKSVGASLYVGPKIQDKLEKISDGLELTVDYGILWFIAQFLFWLLVKIHGVVGNWGWAIVILTIMVKAAFFQLSATSYKSMAHLRRVTPEITRLREVHGNDRAKMSQAMMDLYKKEKINPLGGCLPILVQMPVFIALYWTLMESVELRHADWILWINDLSVMDPYFVLPLLMGASMMAQTALNPAPADPMQARIMKLMPIVFTFMFLWFPAGLVLYWVVNNVLSIAQQWVITRQIEKSAIKRVA
ncbi:MAG: rane protein insertase [Moraxellaceae bacterium]|jgi:YidC/Oxa1 family membrane protein insertase|nr:rane protein insertase [Moraxellaceae bacterium]